MLTLSYHLGVAFNSDLYNMTRTKVYIRNAKGKRIHLLILRGLTDAEQNHLGRYVNGMNDCIRRGEAGPICGITIPKHVDYQVIKL